jgi:hypothetical protein
VAQVSHALVVLRDVQVQVSVERLLERGTDLVVGLVEREEDLQETTGLDGVEGAGGDVGGTFGGDDHTLCERERKRERVE